MISDANRMLIIVELQVGGPSSPPEYNFEYHNEMDAPQRFVELKKRDDVTALTLCQVMEEYTK